MLEEGLIKRTMSSSSADAATKLIESLQSAAASWLAFDLSGQQRIQMDQNLLSAKESREQSLSSRQKLSESTKQFKRTVKTLQQAASALNDEMTPATQQTAVKASESLSKECRTLVSSYKEGIDELTRRCKTSETAYAAVCQALLELPDPSSLLPASIEQLTAQHAQMTQLMQTVETLSTELEQQQESHRKDLAARNNSMSKQDREELIQLRHEVAEYEVEFRSLKNQDITIRKLESRIAELQTAGEEQLQDQLEKAKVELAETEGRRAAEALEREAAMERKVETLELALQAERAGREATQTHLLQADEGVSHREAAWEAQRQILLADSERLREDLQVATRERDELRLENAALQGKDSSKTYGPVTASGVSVEDLMSERAAYQTEVRLVLLQIKS